MKLVCALLTVGALAATTSVSLDEAPASAVSLTLPQTTHTLRLEYRQVGPDFSPYREADGLDAAGLKALQIQSLLSQGGQLQSDVWLRLGEHSLRPGRHPLGFTIGEHGSMHLFVVDGIEAIPLESKPLEQTWSSPRLALQLHYLDRSAVRLAWHMGEYAGSIHIGLGTEDSPDAPPRRRGASDDDTAGDR